MSNLAAIDRLQKEIEYSIVQRGILRPLRRMQMMVVQLYEIWLHHLDLSFVSKLPAFHNNNGNGDIFF